MGNNLTLKTRYSDNEPFPDNFNADAQWAHSNRDALYEQYGEGFVWIYQQQVIGFGKTVPEAEDDARTNLTTIDWIAPNTVVTPVWEFLGPEPQFRFRVRTDKKTQHDAH